MQRNPSAQTLRILERRMRGGPTAEKFKTQRIIMLFTSAGFIASLVVPSLDHRFGWSQVSLGVVGPTFLSQWAFTLFSWYIEKTPSVQRRSKLPEIRKSFSPDRMRSFVIPSTPAHPSSSSVRRWL
jgi:hypothetical protein